ncbi:MAG: DUF4230 domain-containing protein [Bacteroidota bacterium]
MKNLSFLFLLLFFISCSKSEDKETQVAVFELRNIGLLSTSEYTIGKIIELKDDSEWYKFGDRNILISCKAKVKAGIDLVKIQKEDIEVDGKKVTIHLPYPTLISFDMDPNLIKTEMEDINGFRKSFTQEEKNHILALGEKSIKENLLKTSILSHAKQNAELFIENFYKELGFKEIHVEFEKPFSEEISSR